MNTAWTSAWSMRPKVALSKAKPPASDRAEIFRSCRRAQLMAGSKAVLLKASMVEVLWCGPDDNKAPIAAIPRFSGYAGPQQLSQGITEGSYKMRLVQVREQDGRRGLAVLAEDGSARLVEDTTTAYDLAMR